MCRHALGGTSLWDSGRAVIRPFVRASWYAVPLLILTALCVLLVVPGVLAVALVGVVRSCRSLLTAELTVISDWSPVPPDRSPPLAWLVGWDRFCTGAVLLGGAASAFAHVYRECNKPAE